MSALADSRVVYWLDCNCMVETKYCDEYHRRSARIPLAYLRDAQAFSAPQDWEYVPGHRWTDRNGEERWFVQSGAIAPSSVKEYMSEGGEVIRRLVGPWEPVPRDESMAPPRE